MELVCDALLQSGWRCLAARASQQSSDEVKGTAFCFKLFATAFTFLEMECNLIKRCRIFNLIINKQNKGFATIVA
jgi:hypothetical protein